MRRLGRMDAMRGVLECLAKGKQTEDSIMHGLNLSREETDEYVADLERSGLMSRDEGGFCLLTAKGKSVLGSWGELGKSLTGVNPR